MYVSTIKTLPELKKSSKQDENRFLSECYRLCFVAGDLIRVLTTPMGIWVVREGTDVYL